LNDEEPEALAAESIDAQMFAQRRRPAPGGVSIGHCSVVHAGALGCLAKRGNQLFVLSNNHGIGLTNAAPIGPRIPQPGRLDGGVCPADVIAGDHLDHVCTTWADDLPMRRQQIVDGSFTSLRTVRCHDRDSHDRRAPGDRHSVVVLAGALTVYDESCARTDYGPGQSSLGGAFPHGAHNEAPEVVDVAITYVYRPSAGDHGNIVTPPTGCALR